MTKFSLLVILLISAFEISGQTTEFTNYYLNYRNHLEDYFSSEEEDETGESQLSQSANSEEYLFDRMHSDHGLDALQYFKVLREESEAIRPYRNMNTNFNWNFLGPTNLADSPIGMHHQGRIECFVTTQSNPGVICYAGSPTSGIWKTVDSGAHWQNITDGQIPMAVGCQEIVMDPLDENTLYASIGLSTSLENIHGVEYYGLGIYVTHDAGVTWNQTGVNFDGYSWHDNVWKIFMNPTSPMRQYAITNFQVLRTNDGWQSYDVIFGVSPFIYEIDQAISQTPQLANSAHLTQSCCYKKKVLVDLDVNPSNWNDVIICSIGAESYSFDPLGSCINLYHYHPAEVWRSNNANIANSNNVLWTFQSQLTTSLASNSSVPNTVNVSFSLLGTNSVYAIVSNYNGVPFLYKSVNSWVLLSGAMPNVVMNEWKGEFECSKTDPNMFFLGGTDFRCFDISTMSVSPLSVSNYILHPDVRDISVFSSNSTNQEFIFICEDGGVSKLNHINSNFTLSNFNGSGLDVTQLFGMDVRSLNQVFFTGGAQDNSEIFFKNGFFKSTLGGDRYDGILRYSNPSNYYFTKYQGPPQLYTGSGVFPIDLNASQTFYPQISIPSLNVFKSRWNASFDRDWQNSDYAFIGGTQSVGKIDFSSTPIPTFSQYLVTPNPNTRIRAIKVSKSNPQVILVAYEGAYWAPNAQKKLFITKNGGSTWIDLTAAFNTNPQISQILTYYGINALEIDPQNPGRFFVGLNGTESAGQSHIRIIEVNVDLTYLDAQIPNTLQIINHSMGFPRLPVNDLQFAITSGKDLMAATDIGVFYCDMSIPGSIWSNVNNNLPTCVVSDIEFDPFHNEIYLSTFGRGYWKSPMSCEASGEQHIIGSNNVINYPMTANQTIVIDPGATLTVTSTLSFVENAKLIVKPGAKLIVNGGTLTNACSNTFWQGVELHGVSSMTQDLSVQGLVQLLNNARISNARCGIRVCGMASMDPWIYDFTSTGGIVQATNALFLNNRKDIEFLSYTNFSSVSYFDKCRFWVDEYLPNISNLDSRVSMFEISGVKFIDCDFDVKETANYDVLAAGNGIYSLLSSPKIGSTWGSVPNEANPQDLTAQTLYTPSSEFLHPTIFKNFKYAIHMIGDGSLFNAMVRNSVFYHNQYGVYVENQSNTAIYRNKFIYAPNVHYQKVGVYLDRCTQYKVERNYFMGNLQALSNTYGVYLKRSGPNSNEIFLNDYTLLDVGTACEGDQADNTGTEGGLQILCEEYIKVNFDIAVLAPTNGNLSEIASLQGVPLNVSTTDPNNGADNLFDQGTNGVVESDFYNCTSCTPIKYFMHPAPPARLKPIYKSNNVSVSPSSSPFISRLANCPVDHDLETTYVWLIQKVVINKTVLDIEKIQYLQLLDGGIPEELISFTGDLSNSSEVIRNSLLPIAPYLSVTLLDTLMDRSSTMNPWHLTEILVACSPLDPFIYKRINELPSYLVEIIDAYQNGDNPKLLQQFKMKTASTNKLRALAKLMEISVDADSLIRDFTQVKNLLLDNSDFVESRMLYDIYLAENKFDSALVQYDTYLASYYKSSANDLNHLILEVKANGGFGMADSIYKNQIQSFINQGGEVGEFASSLMQLFGENQGDPILQYPIITRSLTTETPVTTKVQLMKVFPNPVDNEFTVGLILPMDRKNAYLNIYNEVGALIQEFDLSKSNGVQYLNASDWANGLYVLELAVNGIKVETQKVVVKH